VRRLNALTALFAACMTAALQPAAAEPLPAGYATLTGSTFVDAPVDLLHGPRIRELSVPITPDANAIWGATGRDSRGHIWFGVSAHAPRMSAHLFEYDPQADRWHDRGAVVDKLVAAGVQRPGEGQIKIHSKIITGSDGWLYFASTDEEGEQDDGSAPPRWGGHLWRVHPQTHQWQHLASTPDGLVAANGVGRFLYALGYWGHVLYQYDTVRKTMRKTVVGSVPGHVSRNFVVDARGHAYVPRVRRAETGARIVELIEYDTRLQPIAATRLDHYLGKEPAAANHGITGLTYLSDGRIFFTTHIGHLYEIGYTGPAPATVTASGWFHPQGQRYAPSLFTLGNANLIGGVTQRGTQFDWVVRDLREGAANAYPLDLGYLKDVLLYGSITRDDAGRVYLVGWASNGAGGQRPLVLQLGAPAHTPQ